MYVLILPHVLNHSMYLGQTREGPSNTMTTPRKSPRKRLGLKKKLTPKKGKDMDV